MTRRRTTAALIIFALVAFVWPVHADSTYALKKELRLEAHGGCTFKVPNWTVSGPKKDNLAVLKTSKVKGDAGYFILMLTIEKVPPGSVKWESVRKNVQEAAKKGGAELLLTLGDPWSKTPGFKGRRMLGTLKTKGKKMVVQLISMVQQGRLVTVTLLTAKDTPAANKLIESIAAAAKI